MYFLNKKFNHMLRARNFSLTPAALALMILAAPVAAQDLFRDAAINNSGAQPVIAVLGSDMAPYREALAGLRKEMGSDIPAYIITNQQPILTTETKVVVAFGIKALQPGYPPSVAVISGLAPGATAANRQGGEGIFLHISMTPAAGVIISKIKDMQPGLHRLGVLWTRGSMDFSVQEFRTEAEKNGISLLSFRATTPDDLPSVLRSINGQVEALWLPLDPALLTKQNFEMIKEYSLGNSLPLYTPSDKLAEAGSTASIFCSFEEVGRTAAQAAKKILSREAVTETLTPMRSNTALNLGSAKRVGLAFTERTITEAAQVIR